MQFLTNTSYDVQKANRRRRFGSMRSIELSGWMANNIPGQDSIHAHYMIMTLFLFRRTVSTSASTVVFLLFLLLKTDISKGPNTRHKNLASVADEHLDFGLWRKGGSAGFEDVCFPVYLGFLYTCILHIIFLEDSFGGSEAAPSWMAHEH